MTTDILRSRIRQRLEEMGMSARAASIQSGLSPTTIQAILDRPTQSPRQENLEKIARVLHCDVAYLTGEIDTLRLHQVTPTSATIDKFPIVGVVGASSFYPVDELSDGEMHQMSIGARDDRFPRAKHMAFKVVGDSMVDKGIADGDIVHAVDWVDIDITPMNGMIVVAEETRYSGQMRRWTIKEVEVQPDRYILHPRSPNKTHKPIVIERGDQDDGREVRIMALVIGSIRKLF